MKLCFVSVNGPRETYFVDEPRIQHFREYSTETIQMVYNMLMKPTCWNVTVHIPHFCLKKRTETQHDKTFLHQNTLWAYFFFWYYTMHAATFCNPLNICRLLLKRPKLLVNCQKMVGLAIHHQSSWQWMRQHHKHKKYSVHFGYTTRDFGKLTQPTCGGDRSPAWAAGQGKVPRAGQCAILASSLQTRHTQRHV
jgi:hypothetical protein